MKNHVLIITQEYGNNIGGGVGRVINGMAEHGMHFLHCSILHLKFNFLWLGWKAFLFQYIDGAVQKTVSARRYLKILSQIINKEKITVVHLLHPGIPALRCLLLVKNRFPHLKILYSCHSIVRYDVDIRKNSRWQLWIEEKIINNVDYIHVLNRTSLHYLKQSYPVIEDRIPISIIPNGVDERSFVEIDSNLKHALIKRVDKEKNIVVACMSRWSYGKGLEYLLEAVPLVVGQIPGIRFIIAGKKRISWENRSFAYLYKINKQIGQLKTHVISLGWLNDKERNALFSITDIWVMPSLCEYFPYSILEPMAAKIPIVSSRIDSVLELITEGSDALFYNAKNPVELAEKIIYLATNHEKRDSLADHAFHKVKRNYCWNPVLQQYNVMYRNAI